MDLIALRSFSDSAGSYTIGEAFTVPTHTHARRLIAEGFAKQISNSAGVPSAPAARYQPAVALRGETIRLRGASGLGDAIYLRVVADFLASQGKRVEVLSDYNGVFYGLPVTVSKFIKSRASLVAHYSGGKNRAGTTQFQDMLIAANIYDDVPFTTRWSVLNQPLIDRVEKAAAGRRIVLVHGGRIPMGRDHAYMSMSLLPAREAFITALECARDTFTVRIGRDDELYKLPSDMDLTGKTNITDLMDLGAVCHGVIAQCSFALPLAEIFGKAFLGIWAAAGLKDKNYFVSAITPQKICCYLGKSSRFVVDNWTPEAVKNEADSFFDF